MAERKKEWSVMQRARRSMESETERGGDEARVARARGSGRGALSGTTFANGTPSSRIPPPRAGWAVRINEATTPKSTTHHRHTPTTSSVVEQWANERAPSAWSDRSTSPSSAVSSASSSSSSARTFSNRVRGGGGGGRGGGGGGAGAAAAAGAGAGSAAVLADIHCANNWQEKDLEAAKKEKYCSPSVPERCQLPKPSRFGQLADRPELRGRSMSRNNAIPPLSRPLPSPVPSLSSSSSSSQTVLPGGAALAADNGVEQGGERVDPGPNIGPNTGLSTGTTTIAASGATNGSGTLSHGEDSDMYSVVPARVHDHNRPFPPPRLPLSYPATTPGTAASTTTTTSSSASAVTSSLLLTAAGSGLPPRIPLTTPLTPLSSSFRSRPSPRQQPGSVIAVDSSTGDASSRSLLSSSSTSSTPSATTGVSIDTTATVPPPRSPVGEVSLTVPRPDGERTINEYVETPFKHCCAQERRHDVTDAKRRGAADCPKIDRGRHNCTREKGNSGGGVGGNVGSGNLAATHRFHSARGNQTSGFRGFSPIAPSVAASSAATGNPLTANAAINAVTKQPVSFTKEPAGALASRTAYDPAGLSIMCDFCGRCRCESCREPPPLPSRWLCDNSCFCSAETILDYASCLCCVKGLFYHCVDGNGSGSAAGIDGEVAAGNCADEPCSCTGNRKASRWACLGALTLVMPCLLCYWPFKGCVAVCEACYARHAAQGCRCNPNATGAGPGSRHHPIANDIGDSRDPEKRLLDPVTPEL